MEGLNVCLVCGDGTPNNSNETNTTLFVTSQEFRTVFQCFLKLFEVGDPPWFEKAFLFCSECTRMLTVVSELEKRLKESEQVVKDRLKGSEVKFETNGVYQKDQRYWKVRGPFLSNEKTSTEAGLPPPSLTTTPHEIGLEMKAINAKVNPSVAENEADDDDDDDLEEQHIVESPTPASQEKRITKSSTRSRNPPRRFNPASNEDVPKKRKRFPEHGKTKSDEVEVEGEHNAKPRISSSSQSCVPFSQQSEGGVVELEYIKVEVDPASFDTDDDDERFEVDNEDEDSSSPSEPDSDSSWEIEEKTTKTRRRATAAPVTKRTTYQKQKILPRPPVPRSPPILPKPPRATTDCAQILPDVNEPGKPISSKDINHDQDIHHQTQAEVLQPSSSASSAKPKAEEKAKAKVAGRKLRSTPGKREVSHYGVRLFKVGDGRQYQCSACDAIIMCTKPTHHMTLLRNHVAKHHTDLFKCCECEERFTDQNTLTTHTDHVHTGEAGSTMTINRLYHCPNCQKPIKTSIHDLIQHMWTHFNMEEREEALYCMQKKPQPDDKPFNCDRCSMRFEKEKLLLNHLKKFHDPGSNHEELKKLDDSTFSFHDVILKKGINFEGEEIYKCSKCDDDAVVAKTLKTAKRHVLRMHTRSFKCELCERRFGSEGALQIHMERKHLKTTPIPCHICGYPFYGAKPTKNHLWTHYSEMEKQEALARGEKVPSQIEKRFHCEKCGKNFHCNSFLQKHQRIAHEGEQVPKELCGICGAEVINLASHMRTQHTNKEDYRFHCAVCNRKFVNPSGLRKHKKHCGVLEKNFKCEICGRDFKLKEQLEKHRNGVHFNIRPHLCSQCPMAFADRKILRNHIKAKHEGIKIKQYPTRKPRNNKKKYIVKEEDTNGNSREASDTDFN